MGSQRSGQRSGRRSASAAAITRGPGTISPELEHELEAIADANGCELYHAEFKGNVLRLFIDRPEHSGGVDLGDCEVVSKQVSALLDVVDFGPGRYTLEVSSPGLDRQLYRPRDYRRFVGHLAKVTFRSPETGDKRTVKGLLKEYRDDGPDGPEITVDVTEGKEETLTLPLETIETARLEIEL
jgi:ribosome maturation factor RimP